MSKLPNFFIIGAPKCGTTSLAAWLAEHPNIYMSPVKEPFYFSKDLHHSVVDTWEQYAALFEGAKGEHLVVGEASVFYLFSRVAVPMIEEKLPSSKYIVMVRNPVKMAIALHEQHWRRGYEKVKGFQDAWQLVERRRRGEAIPRSCTDPVMLDYAVWCRLGEQLERLFTIVSRERVLVIVLDDLRENPRKEYLRVLEFLGVSDDGRQEFQVYNPARAWKKELPARIIINLSRGVGRLKRKLGIPIYQGTGLLRFMESLNDRLNTKAIRRSTLPPDFGRELESHFSEDIAKLEQLLSRRFPNWRSFFEAAS